MGVEIKQMLERDYDITMDAKKIRALTFNQLDVLSSDKSQTSAGQKEASGTSSATAAATPVVRYQLKHFAPAEQLVKMNAIDDASATPVFFVSPMDGSMVMLERVVSHLKAPVYGLQCTQQTPLTSIPDVAKEYIQVVLNRSYS
jgi:hypothetical protein